MVKSSEKIEVRSKVLCKAVLWARLFACIPWGWGCAPLRPPVPLDLLVAIQYYFLSSWRGVMSSVPAESLLDSVILGLPFCLYWTSAECSPGSWFWLSSLPLANGLCSAPGLMLEALSSLFLSAPGPVGYHCITVDCCCSFWIIITAIRCCSNSFVVYLSSIMLAFPSCVNCWTVVRWRLMVCSCCQMRSAFR